MTLFSPAFFQALILGALILTTLGALLLITLLLLDLKHKRVW